MRIPDEPMGTDHLLSPHSKNPQERAADYGQETPTWQNSENKMVWKYLSCQTKKRRTLVCVCGLNIT